MERVAGETRITSALSAAELGAWRRWTFIGETRYTLVEIDARRAVKAVSEGSASGYYRQMTTDLHQTPVLRWIWRVGGTLGGIDQRIKEGDGYPARV